MKHFTLPFHSTALLDKIHRKKRPRISSFLGWKVVLVVVVVVEVAVVVVVVVVVSSSSAVFFVDIVTVLFLQNWTFELVVNCMCAGLKKSGGSRGGAAPPSICKTSLLAKQKL